MAADIFPFEIKRLIYDYVDLQTIKSLRQVSISWAAVGLELILLPTFHVKSLSHDAHRLIGIGSDGNLSVQAAKIIKKVVFHNSAWDARYFRRIVCSRHENRRSYEVVAFVPTQAEADALEELDELIARKDKNDEAERKSSIIMPALHCVPHLKFIEISSENPFQDPILRKVWEEYSLEACRPHPYQEQQPWYVLHAAKVTGLDIHHFSHDQFPVFCLSHDLWSPTLCDDVRGLRSLELVICDPEADLSTNGTSLVRLRNLISAIQSLETLSISFEVLGSVSLDFLPDTSTGTLRSLTLASFSLDPAKLFAFLEGSSSTLRLLRLEWVDIPQGLGTWRDFLDDLRTSFGNTLEKFQLSGMTKSVDGDGEQWLLWPQYEDQWNILEKQKSPRTRELEDFVLRGGPWPMIASDVFPFPY